MKLETWLRKNHKTMKEFSELVGLSDRAVSTWVRGRSIPRKEAMARIVEVTNGSVTAKDFYQEG